MARDYTVVIAHFGNPFWVVNLVNKIQNAPGIRRVIVTDQRAWRRETEIEQHINPALSLEMFEGPVEIYQVEPHPINHASLHHGTSMNWVFHKFDFDTSHILLLDSDCFPVVQGWMAQLESALDTNDSLMAEDPRLPEAGHPCLLVIPTSIVRNIDFLEKTLEDWTDTGRLVPAQIRSQGFNVRVLQPQKTRALLRGDLYLNGSFLHFGSMTFSSRKDIRSLLLRKALTYGFPMFVVEKNLLQEYTHGSRQRAWLMRLRYLLSSRFWNYLIGHS